MKRSTKNKRELTMNLRRADLVRLFIRGITNQEELVIRLRNLGHSVPNQGMVSKDLAALRAQMAEQIEEELPVMRNYLHAKILAVQAEAWDAWEDSKQPTQSIKDKSPTWKKVGENSFVDEVEQALEDAGIEEGYILSDDLEVTMTTRDANSAYLTTILNAVKQERELFNVDIKPEALDPDAERPPLTLNFANLDDTQMTVLEALVKAGDEVALAKYLAEDEVKPK